MTLVTVLKSARPDLRDAEVRSFLESYGCSRFAPGVGEWRRPLFFVFADNLRSRASFRSENHIVIPHVALFPGGVVIEGSPKAKVCALPIASLKGVQYYTVHQEGLKFEKSTPHNSTYIGLVSDFYTFSKTIPFLMLE